MLGANSLAAAVGSSVQNVTFQFAPSVLRRKVLVIGTYNPAILTITDEVPVLVTSAADAGDKFGFGFMLHRLMLALERGTGGGIEVWCQPQSEAGGAVVADGEIDWATTAGVVAGTLSLYIAGERYAVTITTGMGIEDLSDAVVAAVNAVEGSPVIAAKTAVTFETTFTAKSKGPEGNTIDISLNLGVGEVTPTGVVAAITAMASGAGIPAMADALDGLGTGDDANEAHFTDMCHGYGQDTTTMDAVLAYVGATDGFVGLYSKTNGRPFRSVVADIATGSAGLAALLVIGNLRRTDRAQGIVAVPGSQSMPIDIAAQAIGHMARISNVRPEEMYVNVILTGVQPGAKADRWTSDFADRDIAVNGGVSPTQVKSGAVTLQNVISFSRPAGVPVDSNGYREMANIAKLQNILESQKQAFEQTKWQGVSIVDDAAKVTVTASKQKARDRNSVLDELVNLARAWEGNAWIAQAQFTIDKLKADPSLVVIRAGGDGFTIIIPVVLSGMGNIIDVTTQFDISFAAL